MRSNAAQRTLSRGWIVIGLATVMYLYLLFPTFIIVPMSFGNRTELVFPPQHLSLDLYRDYFGAGEWLNSTGRSALYGLLATTLAMVVAVPAAYVLTRTKFPGKRLLVMLLLSPMMVPAVVIALGVYLYFLKLSLTGKAISVVLAHTMYVAPFIILTVSAGVESLDERLEKAAVIMGASQWRVFRQVVLPQLVPSLISAALFAFLMSFDEVVISYFITGPETVTLPVQMYSSIKWSVSPVLAAVATMLTGLSVVACLITQALKQRRTRASRKPADVTAPDEVENASGPALGITH